MNAITPRHKLAARNSARRRKRCRRQAPKRAGAVIVEFAIVAPIFFLLLFGSIEFARLNMMRHAADNAAYEAARHAIVPGGSSAEAINQANAMLAVFGFSGATVTVTPSIVTDNTLSLTVNVDIPVSQNAWIFPRFTGGKTVRGTSTLRTERYRPT